MRSVLANQRRTLTGIPSEVDKTPETTSLQLYPNPAKDQLFVAYKGKIEKVTMLNFLGRKMSELQGSDAASGKYDISKLQPGNYLIAIEAAGTPVTAKFSVALK